MGTHTGVHRGSSPCQPLGATLQEERDTLGWAWTGPLAAIVGQPRGPALALCGAVGLSAHLLSLGHPHAPSESPTRWLRRGASSRGWVRLRARR